MIVTFRNYQLQNVSCIENIIEDNVCSVFVHLGFSYQVDVSPYLLVFDENMLRESQGFKTLWQRDYPLDNCRIEGGLQHLDGSMSRINLTESPVRNWKSNE
jgi:hypothetical protein